MVGTFAIQDARGHVGPIRTHFRRVLEELRQDTPAALPMARRRARARMRSHLEVYAASGRFPRNTGPRRYSPVFHDPDGPRCAAAHLMAMDGHGGTQLALRIAAAHNTVRFRDLPDGDLRDELKRWLDENGLTLDELARIQPSYPVDLSGTVLVLHPLRFWTAWLVGSTALLGAAIAALQWVILPIQRRLGSWTPLLVVLCCVSVATLVVAETLGNHLSGGFRHPSTTFALVELSLAAAAGRIHALGRRIHESERAALMLAALCLVVYLWTMWHFGCSIDRWNYGAHRFVIPL